MLYGPMPDPTDVLIAFLKADATLAPQHNGRVATKNIAGDGCRQQLTMLPGAVTQMWEATTEFQIDNWGGTEKQAWRLAEDTCSAIYSLRGPVTGGHCIAAYPTLRPFSSADPETGRPRFIIQCQIVLAATPEAP